MALKFSVQVLIFSLSELCCCKSSKASIFFNKPAARLDPLRVYYFCGGSAHASNNPFYACFRKKTDAKASSAPHPLTYTFFIA
jgi:hypothetical protein